MSKLLVVLSALFVFVAATTGSGSVAFLSDGESVSIGFNADVPAIEMVSQNHTLSTIETNVTSNKTARNVINNKTARNVINNKTARNVITTRQHETSPATRQNKTKRKTAHWYRILMRTYHRYRTVSRRITNLNCLQMEV